MAATSTLLKGIAQIGESQLNDQLRSNTVAFLDWGLLNIGGFFNVTRPTSSGAYGGRQYRLRLSEDDNYEKGQVWEGFRSNWVWESGLQYPIQPTQISGVYLNGTFLPTATTGNFAYSINYPLGRVTFNNPIVPTSQVELNFSYKYINVYEGDAPWFKELQFNSFRVDDPQFSLYGSGVWSVMAQNRIQMPAIVVEPVPRRRFVGYQLGGGQWVYQDVLFHIFSEDAFMRDQLVDIITTQRNAKITLFDKNQLIASGAMPINYNGSLNANPLCYPDLVANYPWNAAYFFETSSEEENEVVPGFYQAITRVTFEIDKPNI